MTSVSRSRLALAAFLAVAGLALFAGSGQRAPGAAEPRRPVDVAVLVDAFSAGDSRAVVRRLEREARLDPTDPTAHTYLGLGYQQLFRETARPSWLSRARVQLEQSVTLGNGRDALTLAGLAQVSATQHRFRDAERHARAALRVAPGNVTALSALADALIELGRYREAFAITDRIAFDGPSVGGYARVARARELLGRRAGALDAIELAVEAGSSVPEQQAWALSRYGEMLLAQGRVERAHDAFRRSLAQRPSFPHARAGLAKVDVARGRLERAVDRLETLLATVPSAEYAVALGDLYLAQGHPSQAEAAYERAERFERALARHGVRTMLASASLDLDRGVELRSALDRARRAYREAPNVETLDLMAWALERNGRCAEARRWSQRSLAHGALDAGIVFHRGMIERCLGRDEIASRWFRRALALDPAFSVRWAPVARRLSS